MSEVQAAVGRSQLRKLDLWVARRREHAAAMRDALSAVPALRVPPQTLGVEHAWYRFALQVRPEMLAPGWDRDRLVAAVAAEGVPCQHGGCTEIYRERAFDLIRPRRSLPVAAELGRTALALLVHPTLTRADVRDTVDAVCKVTRVAGR
jgi:dTDP-4-amino-4,6-dideoxygalactose transaminase